MRIGRRRAAQQAMPHPVAHDTSLYKGHILSEMAMKIQKSGDGHLTWHNWEDEKNAFKKSED
ncbi:unnamed protein product [Dovyalis caffra]|uniref:Uncharacterized protein n=1 Tax=Dovyalis caffra TaxID=77055 RepID=A0AAV1QTK6_9ROSI|nr:unnamed protein product [Dovyalis caffra]